MSIFWLRRRNRVIPAWLFAVCAANRMSVACPWVALSRLAAPLLTHGYSHLTPTEFLPSSGYTHNASLRPLLKTWWALRLKVLCVEYFLAKAAQQGYACLAICGARRQPDGRCLSVGCALSPCGSLAYPQLLIFNSSGVPAIIWVYP